MAKPIKPDVNLPPEFAPKGKKTDFPSEKIENGFDPVDPDVLAGDNLNKFIDDTYKSLNYSIRGIEDLYKGAVLYDANETYSDKSIVFNIEDNGNINIYKSLTTENKGNELTDLKNWQKVNLNEATSDGFSLFDTKATDHILEGNDAIGWALQGSLITNVYTDAVNKIKNEYNNGIPSQNPILIQKEANKAIYIKENSIALIPFGFDNNGYKQYKIYQYNNEVLKYTGTTSEAQTYIWATEHGGGWDISEYHISDTAPVVSDRDAVWYDTKNNKIKRTDTQGVSWADELLSLPMAKVTTSGILVDESHYGFKSIDEIYNGFEFLEILKFPYTKAKNGHRITDISQKEAVDNLFTTTGKADLYILDSTNNQFYLPRSRWFAQFTLDTNLVNNFNEAAIPNIKARWSNQKNGIFGNVQTVEGAVTAENGGGIGAGGGASGNQTVWNFDASLSSSVYSNNAATVQPPSTNKLLYYKVGNTVINESKIDIGNASSKLQLKVDKNLENVDKYLIQSMFIPDYTKGIQFVNDVYYTAPCNGWVIGSIGFDAAQGDSHVYVKSPQNKEIEIITSTTEIYNVSGYMPITFFLEKGWSAKCHAVREFTMPKFYPVKG